MTYLGYTCGRKHQFVEWQFQWGWPPVKRVVHRVADTAQDEIRLWVRWDHPPNPSAPLIPTLLGSWAVPDHAWSVEDEHGCIYTPYISEENSSAPVQVQLGGIRKVEAWAITNIPIDGSHITLRLFCQDSSRAKQVGEFRIKLPSLPPEAVLLQPDRLPAVKRAGDVSVVLHKVEWEIDWNLYEKQRSDPFSCEEFAYYLPHLKVHAPGSEQNQWYISGYEVAAADPPMSAPKYSDKYSDIVSKLFGHDKNTISISPFMTCLCQPVYRLKVEIKNIQTGERRWVEFLVPSPLDKHKHGTQN